MELVKINYFRINKMKLEFKDIYVKGYGLN